MELIFPLLILFMIGLLFMNGRQRKKQQEQQEELMRNLAVGDVVVMGAGVSGTVVDVDDELTVDVEIAPDVITTWRRYAVREKLVDEAAEAAEDSDDDTRLGDSAVDGPLGEPTTEKAEKAEKSEKLDGAETPSVPSRSS